MVAALRVHAVSRSNWYLVLPTLALGLVPVGTNAVRTHISKSLKSTEYVLGQFVYAGTTFVIVDATGIQGSDMCLESSNISEETFITYGFPTDLLSSTNY